MTPTRQIARRAAELIAVGLLVLYGSVSGSIGCGGDQACIQWGEDEGPCPPKAEAIRFMAPTCDVRLTIESEGDYDGVTCCYDVIKEQLEGCPVDGSTVGVSTAVSSTATVSSSSGPPPSCDGTGDCFVCQQCATMFGGPCSDLADQCSANPECSALQGCLMGCAPGDDTCTSTCMNVHAMGVADFEVLNDCTTCQACSLDCGCQSG
jgi:hypothetical protein